MHTEYLSGPDLERLTGTKASTWRYWASIGRHSRVQQVHASTAEAPGLECNVDRTCLGIDLRLLSLHLSRNRSRLWVNETVNHRSRWPDRSRRNSHVRVRG
jgi:hypothetical protein